MPGIRYKKDIMSPEQLEAAKKFLIVEDIATEAGFDEEAFACTEFSLMPFFKLIVERCAVLAEQQAVCYTGEHKESVGCHAAAAAIRQFGQGLVRKEKTYIVK